MKLTFVFLVAGILQVSAKASGQAKVSINLTHVEIAKALKSIEAQGEYRFLYNNNLKDLKEKINVELVSANIKEALDKMFAGTDLGYKILENNLIVVLSNKLTVQDIKITGKITGENGEALSGVSISLKGTSLGTTSDNNGMFTLTVPEKGTLVVSSIGYQSQEVPVNSQSLINVKLVASKKALDEVVVIGYGTASKRDLTGSITKIAGKEIADKPNTNPINSLEGKVAGLQVTPTGRLGEQPDVRILGTISKTQTAPLYIVDGIFNDNIDFVNPADIESIEVLKDASSLAIFGVKGANGAIIVTTKSGKVGALTVNFNTSVGIKSMVDKIALVDGPQYQNMVTQQFINDGTAPYQYWDKYTGNTDWQKAISQTGKLNYNNISITSGTDRNKFYMGIGYSSEEGLIKYEKSTRWTFTAKDELKVSRNIKIGFNVIGYQNKVFSSGDFGDAVAAAPDIVPFNTKYNVYSQMPFGLQDAQVDNPLRAIVEGHGNTVPDNFRVVGNAFAEINFLKKFDFKATYYADLNYADARSYTPLVNMYNAIIDTISVVNPKTSVEQNNTKTKKFQQDYLLTYTNRFGEHGLTLLAGFSTIYNSYNQIDQKGSQYTTGNALPIPKDQRFWYLDNFFVDPTSITTVRGVDYTFGTTSSPIYVPQEWEQSTVSYFARALYNYKGKYMLNASFRRDGSSDISPANRFQNFEAFGAAWDISKESFMEKQNLFNFLKLKGSWGILGNQATSIHYAYEPLLTPGSSAPFGPNGGQVISAYAPAFYPDPNLKWETVTATTVGVEFGMFNNKLTVDGGYYNKQTKNLLTTYPGVNGTKPGITNVGGILNRGIELSIGWRDKLSNDFGYSINGNITTLNNKVTSLYQGAPIYDGPTRTMAGDPIGSFFGYQVIGVIQNPTDSAKSPQFGAASHPGDLKFKDVNGSGTLTDSDRTIIGNPTPKFIYGFSVSLNYKNFDLGVDFQGVYGNQIYRNWGNGAGYARLNYRAARLNAWHGDGTSNWEPILSDAHANNQLASSYMIESGSYLRIRNVQLGYSIKPSTLSAIHLKALRIYVSGQNLKTFKHNSGYTPEVGGSATQFGVDGQKFIYPVPAVYTLGLNLSF